MARKPTAAQHKQAEREQLAAGRWPELQQQWASIPAAELQAAHRRAAQLVAGGWGAVVWPADPEGEPDRG